MWLGMADNICLVLQDYDRKLDAQDTLDDLRELGLEVKDSRTGNYIAPNGDRKGANGFNNGFSNPASMGQPLSGTVVNV